jgi:hypothetical protein
MQVIDYSMTLSRDKQAENSLVAGSSVGLG